MVKDDLESPFIQFPSQRGASMRPLTRSKIHANHNTPKFNKKLESCTFNLPREVLDNVEDPYGTISHPARQKLVEWFLGYLKIFAGETVSYGGQLKQLYDAPITVKLQIK